MSERSSAQCILLSQSYLLQCQHVSLRNVLKLITNVWCCLKQFAVYIWLRSNERHSGTFEPYIIMYLKTLADFLSPRAKFICNPLAELKIILPFTNDSRIPIHGKVGAGTPSLFVYNQLYGLQGDIKTSCLAHAVMRIFISYIYGRVC